MIKIPYTPPTGFDMEAHRKYVESGGCPYVSGKTWCNGRNNDMHQNHYALRFHPGTKVDKVKLFRARRIEHKNQEENQ